MRDVFHIMLKFRFILEIFTFFPDFGYVLKRFYKKVMVNFKIYVVIG